MKKTGGNIYIGVIGGREAESQDLYNAYILGGLIAQEGWLLVCGGMGGIMEEACRGAREAGGITLGILPGHQREEANPYLTYSIVTGLGEGRNLIVAKSSNAVIALSGSYGTLSEIAFARLNNIPVVGLGSWQGRSASGEEILSFAAASPEEAVTHLKGELRIRI